MYKVQEGSTNKVKKKLEKSQSFDFIFYYQPISVDLIFEHLLPMSIIHMHIFSEEFHQLLEMLIGH